LRDKSHRISFGGFSMAPASLAERVFETIRPVPAETTRQPGRTEPNAPSGIRPAPLERRALRRNASDDEILGLGTTAADSTNPAIDDQLAFAFDAPAAPSTGMSGAGTDSTASGNGDASAASDNLSAILDENPELRRDSDDAKAYRETFATPEDARAATALLSDLNRMDSLFFSRRTEDHAELARSIAGLDPAAFASLAQAMAAQVSTPHRSSVGAQHAVPASPAGGPGADAWHNPANSPALSSRQRAGVWPDAPLASRTVLRDEGSAVPVGDEMKKQIPRTASRAPENRGNSNTARDSARDDNITAAAEPTHAQTNFFHATNAAAVETVIEAIESQVERLLPDGVSKNARNRVVGEIYRELDGALRSNRQLTEQMRNAFRSGSLDAEHQRAIVSLVAGRARQALPAVAKRVLNEWTSTVVAASHDRRARQRAAERRVDIAGSSGGGNESHRPTSPRDIDYARMSDGDILNL
jgi:hypothetical protein